jgi:hypothetical protein
MTDAADSPIASLLKSILMSVNQKVRSKRSAAANFSPGLLVRAQRWCLRRICPEYQSRCTRILTSLCPSDRPAPRRISGSPSRRRNRPSRGLQSWRRPPRRRCPACLTLPRLYHGGPLKSQSPSSVQWLLPQRHDATGKSGNAAQLARVRLQGGRMPIRNRHNSVKLLS